VIILLEKFKMLKEYLMAFLEKITIRTRINEDEYLRSIDGMVQSINEAREEPNHKGVRLDTLDW
jgi:hypothetical protein